MKAHASERRLGIVGVRNAGKSCYLSCLYGRPANERVGIVFRDEATIAYLDRCWKEFPPPANAKTEMHPLHFAVKTPDRTWQAVVCDYAGTLVQRVTTEDGITHLRKDARHWIRECHTVLFFLDCSAPEADWKERLNELHLLLSDLRGTGSKVVRPLGLVLTKWDLQGPISTEPAREEQRALEFLGNRLNGDQIVRALNNDAARTKVFPTSAFGAHGTDNRPPTEGPQPFNLQEPIYWAMLKSDEMLFDQAQQRAEEALGGFFPRYRRAIRAYERLVRRQGIDGGPWRRQALERLEQLRVERAGFWRRVLPRITAAAIFLFVLGWAVHESLAWWQVHRALENGAAPPSEVRSACHAYLDGWHPGARLFGLRQKVEEGLDAYEARLIQNEFEALQEFRSRHPEDDDAAVRAERNRRWLDQFPNSTDRAATVKAWLAEDESAAVRWQQQEALNALETFRRGIPGDAHAEERLAKVEEFRRKFHGVAESKVADWDAADRVASRRHSDEQAYNALRKTLAALPDQWDKQIEECEGFLSRFPQSAHLAQVKEAAEEAQRARDDLAWAAVERFARANPDDYAAIDEKIGKYLAKPDARNAERAKALQKQTQRRKDDKGWGDVQNYARKNPYQFDAIMEKAHEYLLDLGAGHRDEAKALIAETEKEKDREAWRAVQAWKDKHPDEFEEIISRCRKYRNGRGALQPSAADELVAETIRAWDKYLYDAVARTAADAEKAKYDADAVERVYRKCKDYLEGQQPDKRMESKVQKWVRWFEGLQVERDVYITVGKVSIPDGSHLDSNGNPTKVYLELSGRTFDTVWGGGNEATIDQRLGPYRFKWGDKQARLVVVVEKYRRGLISNRKTRESPITDEGFVLRHCLPGSEVVVKCEKDKEVRVTLDCEEAHPPELPAYPEK